MFCVNGLFADAKFAGLVDRCEKAYKRKPTVSVAIVDLADNKLIYEYNADKLLMPASNQKLLSSVFALERLGSDFKFTTGVYLSSDADVIVVGSFDPLLGDPILAGQRGQEIYHQIDQWVSAIKMNLGGRVVRDIILLVDTRNPLDRHKDWPDKQDGRAYQVPVSRLNFYDNSFAVVFDKTSQGISPRLIPYTRFVKFTGKVRRGRKHIWSLRPNEDESVLKIRGTIKQSTQVPYHSACNNPPLLLGRVLAERLLTESVDFTGSVKMVDYRDAKFQKKLVCRTYNTLTDVLTRANKNSFNLAAECMLLRAGNGRWDGSGRILEKTLTENFNLPQSSVKCSDGCGLSRNNRVTARFMAKLLTGVTQRSYFGTLLDSLALSGTDGTLRKRMKTQGVKGRVSAKTGYIYGVSCLSGYVKDSQGRPRYAFSFLVNNIRGGTRHARKMQDNICGELIKRIDKE